MIGDVIRDMRQLAGLSQRELAVRSGVAQPGLSQLERGQRSPTVRTLERIARALGCDLVIGFADSVTRIQS
jgi:transcriptional regulator with XRE-family HTH domain